MELDIVPGTYVVAVSGGVDSMVLLDILRQKPKIKLVVAHYDHGIRDDSYLDKKLVADFARKHQLTFIHDKGSLSSNASEDQARKARYKFLHRVRIASGARAIITAHHSDDALETAVMQLLRGTGRRGLSSLSSGILIERPILHVSKRQLKDYANENGLVWREDSSNSDTRFARNRIRHNLLPKLSSSQKDQLHELILNMRKVNNQIDTLLDLALHVQPAQTSIERQWFIDLPHSVSTELLTHWLRRHGVRDFDKRRIQKLVVDLKTIKPGHQLDVGKGHIISIKPRFLALVGSER